MTAHLHFDCFSGISGDMALAALIDVGAPFEAIAAGLDSLGLPARIRTERTSRKGIAATRIVIDAEPQHQHRHLHHIEKIIDAGRLSDAARHLAKRIFLSLAEAEAAVHGTTIPKVHFHEVGALDSIFDIVGVAMAIDLLKPQRVTSSPIPTGTGWVDCEHGKMPVPAPATARLLAGLPLADCDVPFEMTTPTGAAIVRTLADGFERRPPLMYRAIGYGAGNRELESRPNVLRVFYAAGEASGSRDRSAGMSDAVAVLETDLDDCTGEQVGFAVERLFEAGALDVHTTAIQMKKQRPGVSIKVICRPEDVPVLEEVLFRQTGTFGIRRFDMSRHILARETVEVSTPLGSVRAKLGWKENWKHAKPEYDDCARLARERGMSIREVMRITMSAMQEDAGPPR